MDEGLLDVEEVKAYWFSEAEEALQVADHLVEKGDYSYALFFGHLAVEKILKPLTWRVVGNILLRSTICSDWPELPDWSQMRSKSTRSSG